MARTLTPQDCHVLMNLLVKEATGQNSEIQEVDASNFVSVGEMVLATGTENVLNSLSLVLGRTFMAVRPYKSKNTYLESVLASCLATLSCVSLIVAETLWSARALEVLRKRALPT